MKSAFLDDIMKVPISNGLKNFEESIYGFSYNNRAYIVSSMGEFDVSILELESSMKIAILNQVDKDKKLYSNIGENIKKITNPICLAYSIKNGYITNEEFMKISDNKIDKDVFVNLYDEAGVNNLPSTLVSILLNPISEGDLLQKKNSTLLRF